MDPTPVPSRSSAFFQELSSRAGLVITTLFVGVLTVFSDYFVDKLKTGINRANTRTTYFDAISKELSTFVFAAELAEEVTHQRMTHKAHITTIITEYNTAITTLRKNEYYHYALLHKYWDEEALRQYHDTMRQAKAYDSLLHRLNPVLAQLDAHATDKVLVYTPAMDSVIRQEGPGLHTALGQLKRKSGAFLQNF